MNKHEMMLNAFVENIKTNHKDDVGLIIVYGSYVNNTMNELSDVDVMFVGKTDKAYGLQKQYIYEGVGYDFFCMSVERVHKIIDEYQPLISILAEGRLLYADSEEKVGHFKKLQERLANLDKIEPVDKYFWQVDTLLKEMKANAFDHQFASIETKRHLQGYMIYQIMHFMQLINRKNLKFGTKQIVSELQAMPLRPKTLVYHLELLTKDTVQTRDIMNIVQSFEAYYQSLREQYCPFDMGSLNGFYEEECSVWNKIITAAKNDDIMTAYLAATSIENELVGYRKHFTDLTNLFSSYDSTVESLLDSAKKTETEILHILKEQQINVRVFSALDDVLEFLSRS